MEPKEAIRKFFYHLKHLMKFLQYSFCKECFRCTVQKEEKL
jgi:hypothetical protein